MNPTLSMHIPDGFLSAPTSGGFWLASVAIIAIALRKVEKEMDDRKLPLMAVMAAAIFAGQMLNFSVSGGTSGHLLGAALAVIFLGVWPAVIVMASVVIVQALVFQDGGLVVLGANLFNMAVVGAAAAYFVLQTTHFLFKKARWARLAGTFCAGWLSIVVAALAASFQLAISGTSPAQVVFPAMGGIHALIGLGEGIITAAASGVVMAARPELLAHDADEKKLKPGIWAGGLLLSLALVILAPLASSHPDGLEWVAEQSGFLQQAKSPVVEILPDYLVPGIGNEALATILAGMIGVALVALTVLASGRRKTADE